MFRVSFRQMISNGTNQDVYKRLLFSTLVVAVLINRRINYTSTELPQSIRLILGAGG